nr:immune inhibitor A [Myxococcales bacterium]
MNKKIQILLAMLTLLSIGCSSDSDELPLMSGPDSDVSPSDFTPGAEGIGDPYYPTDGNGGYNAEHYALEIRYDPETDQLEGKATITANANQSLSRFNFDLEDLEVSSVTVNGEQSVWEHDNSELSIEPPEGILIESTFEVVVEYNGIPSGGFSHEVDGALILGQPHVAADWFPVNDHPSDIASYTLSFTVPEEFQVAANGELMEQTTDSGWTTWMWDASEPMAPYLVGVVIGKLDFREYEDNGIFYLDAVQSSLFEDTIYQPTNGDQFIASGSGNDLYNRLSRVVSVPADGASLTFDVQGVTEAGYDFFVVEARTAGGEDWTTLPDVGGRAQPEGLDDCAGLLAIHPALSNYLSTEGEGCLPQGASGEWWAFSGEFDGTETWVIDLSAWSGQEVEVSLSYITDASVRQVGVFIDNILVSTGEGGSSFEEDEDPLDGWEPSSLGGTPEAELVLWERSETVLIPGSGDYALQALERQPEVITFLEEIAGPYPYTIAGGIVAFEFGAALETQTRPVYSSDFFDSPESVDNPSIVVHELAHQWFGNSLTLSAWQHIWLNEGFATYMQWMWDEHLGILTAEEIFQEEVQSEICGDDGFIDWSISIADPGPDLVLTEEVYDRGAMVLHALRQEIGDEQFAEVMQGWAQDYRGQSVSSDEFIALASSVSDQNLDELFETWLFSTERPDRSLYCLTGLSASAPAVQ